jgi:hypothetical protein
MVDLFAEKLAKVTDARRANRVLERARAQGSEAARLAAEAKADRDAAAKERAELADGRKDFRKFFAANGMDPKTAYEEMTRQALEADTPDAKLKVMQAAWKAELAETVEPLKKTIAELTEEKKQAAAQATERSRQDNFNRAVQADAYESLRDEYPPESLYRHVQNMIVDPELFYAHQERLKVRLTSPGKGYNMEDILNVLKSAQDEHETGKQTRRATRAAPTPSDAAPNAAPSPTVNGTRTAATTTIGNDLTTARAADGKFIPKGATAAQRIRERARRLGAS